MRLLLLTQAELLKLLRSRVYLVTTAIFIVLAVFWPGYCAGLLALSDNDMCATDALGWPSSLDQSLGFVDGLSTVLMTLLGGRCAPAAAQVQIDMRINLIDIRIN